MIKGSEKSDRFVVVAPVAILPNEFFGTKIMTHVHVHNNIIHLFIQEVSNRCQSVFLLFIRCYCLSDAVCHTGWGVSFVNARPNGHFEDRSS